MKIKSTCTTCGKSERVSERIVTRDEHGNFHTCDHCLNATRQWQPQTMTKKEIRQRKK